MVDSIATFDQKVIYSLSINIPIIIPLMLNHVMTDVHQPMDPYGVVQSVGGGAIEAMGPRMRSTTSRTTAIDGTWGYTFFSKFHLLVFDPAFVMLRRRG